MTGTWISGTDGTLYDEGIPCSLLQGKKCVPLRVAGAVAERRNHVKRECKTRREPSFQEKTRFLLHDLLTWAIEVKPTNHTPL